MKYNVSDILKPLIAAGTIDGMGMQSHISMSTPTMEQYKGNADLFGFGAGNSGNRIDVSQKPTQYADQLELAQRYQDCFKMYKEMKASGVKPVRSCHLGYHRFHQLDWRLSAAVRQGLSGKAVLLCRC